MLPPDQIRQHTSVPFAVFTDLDGTLLDHDSYSYEPAQAALAVLSSRHIPWVLNTSKTLAELRVLARDLHNTYPLIFENGAGVAFPPGYDTGQIPGLDNVDGWQVRSFATPRSEVIKVLARFRQDYRFKGFAEMTIEEIVAHTGLDRDSAALAAQRGFTEPVLWQDSAENYQAFCDQVLACNLHCLKGGRFTHIMSPCDKGAAMLWLAEHLPGVSERTKLIALGDSANDVAMLEQADIAVVVRSPAHPPPTLAGHSCLRTTEDYGPTGWNQAILAILRAHDTRQQ